VTAPSSGAALVGRAFVRDGSPTVHALRDDGRTACGLVASRQVAWLFDGRECRRCTRVVAARLRRDEIEAQAEGGSP
jgi:hypothetical protein